MNSKTGISMESVVRENLRELSGYMLGNSRKLEFAIPDTESKGMMALRSEKRRGMKINKPTSWYQRKKIKEGKTIKVYNKTKVRIG